MAAILITGGAGFIGSNFARYWRSNHPRDGLVVLDSLTYAGDVRNLGGIGNLVFNHGDIRDQPLVERLLRDHGIDTIVHLAAESHVDRSIRGSRSFIESNVLGTQSLLEAAKATWLDSGSGRPHRFHHASTDEVFGCLAADAHPVSEGSPYAPNSPYAASKAASDHLVRAFHRTYGMNVVTTHCSNNYGPYQFPEKLIPRLVTNALLGKPLPLYGDGTNLRSWLHVEDHCRGLELALLRGRTGESYNIGGTEEVQNLELAAQICAHVDEAFRAHPSIARRYPDAPAARGIPTRDLLTFVSDRPGHDRRYSISSAKITAELGYSPRHGLEQSLAATLDWYLAQPEWWADKAVAGPDGY
jgi:dTDP-glucose 4,6-dehydratase